MPSINSASPPRRTSSHESAHDTLARTESLLLLSLIVAPLTACKSTPPPAAENQPSNVGVETTVAHVQQSTDYLEVPARVSADPSQVVRIFPPLSGRILGLRVLPGQEVKKGDIIAQLQSSDIAAARSDFEKAKIEVIRADRALTRGKLLLQHEVLSQADYYELEATAQSAHSELDRARQSIHELGFAEDGVSDEVALRSPISGVVLDIGTAAGEMQRSLDNANAIATIANIDTVWIVGDVFERDLASRQARPRGRDSRSCVSRPQAHWPHRQHRRRAGPHHPHAEGARRAAQPQAHPQTGYVRHDPRPAQSGTPSSCPPPRCSTRARAPTSYSQRSGKFDQRTVPSAHVRLRRHKTIEILSGLNDGDKVVTAGGALLRPTSGE